MDVLPFVAFSYGLKYYTELYDRYNRLLRIEIHEYYYTGVSSFFKTTGNALQLSYPGDDTDLMKPIFGSQAKITILSESNFQYIDLHTANSRQYRVKIYREGEMYWTGWLLPDLFTEPYVAAPYPITISARCGLGELKELDAPTSVIDIKLTEGDTTEATTRPTLYSIIVDALLSIGSSYFGTLNEAINVYNNYDDNETTDSPLTQTRINLSAFDGMTYYEALSDILVSFGARLYQQNGDWYIIRIKELDSTLVLRSWEMSKYGVNVCTVTTDESKTFKVGRPEGSQIVNSSPSLDVNPAWKKATIIQDLGFDSDGVLENGNFEEKGDEYVFRRAIYYKPGNWAQEVADANTPALLYTTDKGEYFCALNGVKSIRQSASVEKSIIYAQSAGGGDTDTVLFEGRLLFSIDCIGVASRSNVDFSVVIRLYSASAGTTFYCNADGEWVEDAVQIDFNDIDTALANRYVSDFTTKTISIDAAPADGVITVIIYPSDDDNESLAVGNVALTFRQSDKTEFYDEKETFRTILDSNIYTPDDVESVCFDLPDVPNAEKIWSNGFRLSSGNIATSDWHERDSLIDWTLTELLIKNFESFFYSPQLKLKLPILSSSIQFDSCIVDYQILSKKYICNGFDVDCVNCISTGTYIEFSVWEDANWILADGTWNDSGIWVDGDVWNDEDPD